MTGTKGGKGGRKEGEKEKGGEVRRGGEEDGDTRVEGEMKLNGFYGNGTNLLRYPCTLLIMDIK